MSIALNARIKELERRVAALEARPKVEVRAEADGMAELIERLEALENRPRPGRPRKDSNG